MMALMAEWILRRFHHLRHLWHGVEVQDCLYFYDVYDNYDDEMNERYLIILIIIIIILIIPIIISVGSCVSMLPS